MATTGLLLVLASVATAFNVPALRGTSILRTQSPVCGAEYEEYLARREQRTATVQQAAREAANKDTANDHPITRTLQAGALFAGVSALVCKARGVAGPMDGLVAWAWHAFESVPHLTHAPMFEANLAVGAFVLWIALFESVHLWLPRAKEWRLDGRTPVRPLYGFTRHAHKTVVPAVTYLASIALFHHLHLGALLFGVKPLFGVPSFLRVACELCLGVFLYDAFFYPFHAAFHQLRKLRRAHRRHHKWAASESTAHNAVETVQNSYMDAGVQVAINICVQNLSPWGFKHPLSRAIHNLVVTYLLCESHSGYDLPFQSHRLLPGVFGGAPRHELHHRRGDCCYHQFFMWIDNLRGCGPPEGVALLPPPREAVAH